MNGQSDTQIYKSRKEGENNNNNLTASHWSLHERSDRLKYASQEHWIV